MQNQIVGFRLSPPQARLWLLHQGDPAYNSQCVVRIEGPLKEEILEQVLPRVVERHEILRTNFHRVPGIMLPIQVVQDQGVVTLRHLDLRGLATLEQKLEIAALAQEERAAAYDFENAPPLRARLLKLSASAHILLLTLPTLCADTRTLINLAREISLTYAGCLEGEKVREQGLPYVQFSEWQNELLEQEDAEEGKDFWRRQNIKRSGLTVSLPFQSKPRAETTYQPHTLCMNLDHEATRRLSDVALNHAAKSENILLACWQTLLWRLTGQKEIVTGFVCDGRKYQELQGALGLF